MSLFGIFKNSSESERDMLPEWPCSTDGAPEEPAFLCHCKCNDLFDELRINMLHSYGIPTLSKYPGDGSFGRVVLGMSGEGTDIYVPESKLNDAIELCKEDVQNELS